MGNVDKVRVKGEIYNVVSPSAFGDYIETIGGACTNPNGYAKDAIFLAKTNEVQNLYQATQAIAFGANIVVGTNCKQTTLDKVIRSMSGASTAADVSYSNTSSGLTATDAQAAIDEVNGKTNTNANNISSLNSALSNEVVTRERFNVDNLIDVNLTSGTNNEVSYVVNADKSIIFTVNSTTAQARTILLENEWNGFDASEYAGQSLLVSGGNANFKIFLIYYDSSRQQIASTKVTKSLDVITLPSNTKYLVPAIFVPEGTTAQTYTCYPRLSVAMTNQEITPYVQAISNPNLLDNPFFTVNQRGESSYSNTDSVNHHTWDRWYISGVGSAIRKSSDVMTFSTSVAYGAFMQKLELDAIEIGKTYTLSVRFSDGTIESKTFTTIDGSPSLNSAWTKASQFSAVVTNQYSSQWQIIVFNHGNKTSSDSVSIKAIKLELGSVSTLAMDIAPNYAEELLKCQRYFVRYLSPDNSGAVMGVGFYSANTNARITIPLPTNMREKPSIVVSDFSMFKIVVDGETKTPTETQVSNIQNHLVAVNFTTPAVTNHLLATLNRTTQGAYIDFAADL